MGKGCVSQEDCQTGCTEEGCTICCGTSQCNEPGTTAIWEPVTCQPMNALLCSYRMLLALAQNETIDCRYVHME